MILRDLVTTALQSDSRVLTPQGEELRRAFSHELYDVYIAHYPTGLLAALIHYKRDGLRILTKIGELGASGDWVQQAVALLQEQGRGPFHLIRDAKLDCRQELSLHDRAALRLAGVEIPRSAGRYKDLFLKDS